MADANTQGMNIYEDPKKVRAQIKSERKKLKQQEKQHYKDIRKREREMDEREAELDNNGGGLTSFVLTILIVVMWLIIMSLLIRMDVGGFGSTIMAPILRDVPYLNMILPESARNPSMTSQSSTPSTADDAYVRRLEEQLAEAQNLNVQNAQTITDLQTQVAQLQQIADQAAQLEQDKQAWYDQVLYADNAPDITNYIAWYESIDPVAAAELYQQAVQRVVTEKDVSVYAKTYSPTSMKPKEAAAIFDDMVANGTELDVALAARILLQMSSDDRGAVIGKMDTANAAILTKLMQPPGLPGLGQ